MVKIHPLHFVIQSKGHSLNRKVNEVLVASNGPFLTDMGHSISLVFPLLPSTSTSFKFSPYNRALYTIKPSLTPPPRQLPVSDLETQVICHQKGELEETASPAWELYTGSDSSQCCSTESLNIVKQQSERTTDRDGVLVSVCFSLISVKGAYVFGPTCRACFCFLSGCSWTRDKEKIKTVGTLDRVSSACIVEPTYTHTHTLKCTCTYTHIQYPHRERGYNGECPALLCAHPDPIRTDSHYLHTHTHTTHPHTCIQTPITSHPKEEEEAKGRRAM